MFSDSEISVWVNPAVFYTGPCFFCESIFERWFPLKLGEKRFCDYPCLELYRKSLVLKKQE